MTKAINEWTKHKLINVCFNGSYKVNKWLLGKTWDVMFILGSDCNWENEKEYKLDILIRRTNTDRASSVLNGYRSINQIDVFWQGRMMSIEELLEL